jgi:hypothetical protein
MHRATHDGAADADLVLLALRIEDWHRVLKRGCKIKQLQHKTAERLKRTIVINLVTTWRIMLLTSLDRECPDLPAEIVFSDLEMEALKALAKKDSLSRFDWVMSCVWWRAWVAISTVQMIRPVIN